MVSSGANLLKNQENQTHPEAGSAIIWIFIMIALFAALSFMISDGSRTGGASIDKEAARLNASELINYVRTVKDAVQALRINGCDDADISFANPVYNVAAHIPDPGTAPADNSCHVFNSSGGKLNYKNLSSVKVLDEGQGAIFVTLNIEDIGTTADDLVFVVDDLPAATCEAINFQLHNTQSSFQAGFGALLESTEDITAANCANCVKKTAACAYDTGDDNYNFYSVLVVR